MCLILTVKHHGLAGIESFLTREGIIKTAEAPIVCYKYGLITQGVFESNTHIKRGFQYYKNKITKKVEFTCYQSGGKVEVHQGYHSYMPGVSPMVDKVFIIPKGARYIEGGVNHDDRIDGYVSDQLTWIGSLSNPILRLKLFLYKKYNIDFITNKIKP